MLGMLPHSSQPEAVNALLNLSMRLKPVPAALKPEERSLRSPRPWQRRCKLPACQQAARPTSTASSRLHLGLRLGGKLRRVWEGGCSPTSACSTPLTATAPAAMMSQVAVCSWVICHYHWYHMLLCVKICIYRCVCVFSHLSLQHPTDSDSSSSDDEPGGPWVMMMYILARLEGKLPPKLWGLHVQSEPAAANRQHQRQQRWPGA